MTGYWLFSEADYAATGATGSTDSAVNLGTEFSVSTTSWVTKVRWMRASTATAADRGMALYEVTDLSGGSTGTLLTRVVVPAGAAGAWAEKTLGSPVQLTSGKTYRIVTWHPGDSVYASKSLYFSSGAGGTTSVQGGWLTRPNATNAIGGKQGSYEYGGSYAFTTGTFNQTSYFSDAFVTDVDPTASTLVRRVGQYSAPSGLASTTVNIPLTATTPGTDLIMVGHAAAVMTMPGGWTKTQVYIGDTEIAWWHLPAASHTASLTSVAMTLSAVRRPSVMVYESLVSGSIFADWDASAPSGGSWVTGAQTVSKSVGLAIWTVGFNSDSSLDTRHPDKGFTEVVDTGAVSGSGGTDSAMTRIWAAWKEPVALSGEAVTVLEDLSTTGAHLSPTAYAGVLAWDVVTTASRVSTGATQVLLTPSPDARASTGAVQALIRVAPDARASTGMVQVLLAPLPPGGTYVRTAGSPRVLQVKWPDGVWRPVKSIPVPAFGPDQSAFTTQVPTLAATGLNGYCVANEITFAAAGRITAINYYHWATVNPTARPLRIWSSGGVKLASATGPSTTVAGWKTVTLSTPVAVTAGQVVRAAIGLADGEWAVWDDAVPAANITNGDLFLKKDSYYKAGADVYPDTPTTANCWTDVVFQKAL